MLEIDWVACYIMRAWASSRRQAMHRDEGSVPAYETGVYSHQQIAGFYGLHLRSLHMTTKYPHPFQQ